jgi:hypothetical protein
MPFKSKAQQRFMFAAEDRGDLSKGTAKRWAKHTPDIKHLPAHAKKTKHAEMLEMAYHLGVKEAMEKEGFVESALGSLVTKSAPLWAPAAVGYAMADPENRPMGAMAGLAAGAVGKGLGRSFLRSSRFLPDELALVEKMRKIHPDKLNLDHIHKVMSEHPELAKEIKPDELLTKVRATEQQMPMAEWAGRLGAAGGAGYLLSHLGRSGSGLAGGAVPPGYFGGAYGPSSYAAPAVSDMSSHYMGLTPNG